MIDGHSQGKYAAILGSRVLNGESAMQIPVMEKSPNIPMLDYRVMKHFGLSSAQLSIDTIFINKPTTFYTEHTRIIWITFFIFLFQCLLISYLIINVRQRKQAEHLLNEQKKNLKNIVTERTAELSASNKKLSREVDTREQADKPCSCQRVW